MHAIGGGERSRKGYADVLHVAQLQHERRRVVQLHVHTRRRRESAHEGIFVLLRMRVSSSGHVAVHTDLLTRWLQCMNKKISHCHNFAQILFTVKKLRAGQVSEGMQSWMACLGTARGD